MCKTIRVPESFDNQMKVFKDTFAHLLWAWQPSWLFLNCHDTLTPPLWHSLQVKTNKAILFALPFDKRLLLVLHETLSGRDDLEWRRQGFCRAAGAKLCRLNLHSELEHAKKKKYLLLLFSSALPLKSEAHVTDHARCSCDSTHTHAFYSETSEIQQI